MKIKLFLIFVTSTYTTTKTSPTTKAKGMVAEAKGQVRVNLHYVVER